MSTFFQRVARRLRRRARYARMRAGDGITRRAALRCTSESAAASLTCRASSRHGRHEGDGRRSASDHHDALSCVVQVRRPVLRMDDLPRKFSRPGNSGVVAALVIVIARTRVEELARVVHRRSLGTDLGGHVPARIGRRPLGARDAMPIADLVRDAVPPRRCLGCTT